MKKQKSVSHNKPMPNFSWYHYIVIVGIVALIVAQVYLEMELIELMAELIGKVQYSQPLASIWSTGRKMLLVAALIMSCIIVSSGAAAILSSKFAQRLRANIFRKVNSFSQEEINKFSIPSLITRSTNDVSQVQMTLQMCLRMAIMAPTMAIFSIVKIVNSSIELTWATVIAVVTMFVMFGLLFFAVVPAFNKIQKKTDRINLVARENLTGLRVIRAYNTEKQQEAKFDKENEDITKIHTFTGRVMSLMGPGMNIISNGLALAIYWLGAALINSGSLVYADLVEFQQYGMHILMSFMFLSAVIMLLPRGLVSLRRIREVLKQESKIKEGSFDGKTKVKGKLEFKNVSFRYPDAEMNVLENINFTVNKGETIAFIGSTGSGKSTLVNLIPRFFDASFGEILIDDVNVKDYTKEALNSKLGFVPQKGILFSGTVEENVKYGAPNISLNKVKESLQVAQANFVEKLDGGLNYEIAQGGTNVSGGQRQRLCIARAIAKSPEIYVFDDSFSALDYKTDKALRKALTKYTKDATKVIVAQRVGTILDADKIIVLDQGRMVGVGTHQELMKSCKVYKEIALSQLSKEELA